jgi:hypothetical protein
MAKFKEGDIVVCVNNTGYETEFTIKNDYIVLECDSCTKTLYLETDRGFRVFIKETKFRKK